LTFNRKIFNFLHNIKEAIRRIGGHADWLIEGAVFLIAGLLILLFIVAFGFSHVFLYVAYPAILIVAGIALLIMYFAKRK